MDNTEAFPKMFLFRIINYQFGTCSRTKEVKNKNKKILLTTSFFTCFPKNLLNLYSVAGYHLHRFYSCVCIFNRWGYVKIGCFFRSKNVFSDQYVKNLALTDDFDTHHIIFYCFAQLISFPYSFHQFLFLKMSVTFLFFI